MNRLMIISLYRFLLAWAGIAIALEPGKLSADSIVVVGAGTVGSWDTEVELANPTAAELLVQVGANPVFEGGCPMQCPFTSVILPPKGSAKLRAAEIFHTIQDGLFTMYVRLESGVTLPTVRARVADAGAPSQAVELPAVRLSTITS